MYYILTSKVENDREDAILEGNSIYLDRIECSFRQGLSFPLDDIDTPIHFEIDEFTLRGTMTDHLNLNDIPGPIFSSNVKDLLDKLCVTNIQYFQLNLVDKFPQGKKADDKKKIIEYKNYFIANVVGLVDCVNHKNSILDYFYPPEIREKEKEEGDEINNPFAGENLNQIDLVGKLVLDETKIDPSLKIFRLKDQPNLLLFHESILDLIKKEKLSGFVFVPVEKYTDAIISDDEEKINEEEKIKEDVKDKNEDLLKKQKPIDPPPQPEPTQPQPEVKKKRTFFT